MPIYEFVCGSCDEHFEDILSFEESEKPHPCPVCTGVAGKIPSVPRIRMDRIYDNAEFGPRAFFGEEHAEHENWKDLAEESQMVTRKREELKDRGELNDFVFEEGRYTVPPGGKAKTIEEV